MPRLRATALITALQDALEGEIHEEIYRVYITDTLRIISENTAKYAGGAYATKRYAEIINPPKESNLTAEEIIGRVTKNAGIEVI